MLGGFADINGAQIYYEVAGAGTPLVMIHAGVADSRQWNNEFAHFAHQYQVIRCDLRGYGKSEPVDGEFSDLADLTALLDTLKINQPLVLMGCSMGGGLAIDFALAHPARAKALILVGSAPTGLELDVPRPAKFDEAEQAYTAGNLDLVAELETQIWFDGIGRAPEQVNPAMRQLAYDMNRLGLDHDAKHLGTRLPNVPFAPAERLADLTIPILIIVGAYDTPYILAASDHMVEHMPPAQKIVIQDAAHLPNMDHPAEFQQAVTTFLEKL